MSLKYSIVIGAVNEANIIEESLSRLKDWLVDNDYYDSTEVVIITAEGRDATLELVSRAIKNFKYHNHIKPGPRVGKGRDIQKGMLAAEGDYILFMDADLATPLDFIKVFFERLEADDSIVIGVRNLAKMHDTFFRKFTSILSNIGIRVILWQNIPDTQCGFKAFRRDAAQALFSKQTILGWGFDLEILALARKLGYKIVQIPVIGWKDPKPTGAGLVGDSQIKSMLVTLKDLYKVRLKLIFRRYN